jgi:hypothetical protein
MADESGYQSGNLSWQCSLQETGVSETLILYTRHAHEVLVSVKSSDGRVAFRDVQLVVVCVHEDATHKHQGGKQANRPGDKGKA